MSEELGRMTVYAQLECGIWKIRDYFLNRYDVSPELRGQLKKAHKKVTMRNHLLNLKDTECIRVLEAAFFWNTFNIKK
jgi:hypothetical protein